MKTKKIEISIDTKDKQELLILEKLKEISNIIDHNKEFNITAQQIIDDSELSEEDQTDLNITKILKAIK